MGKIKGADYDGLLNQIKKLSNEEVLRLKSELDKLIKITSGLEIDDLKDFLKTGPIMSDEEFQEFESQRKKITEWRGN